MKDSLLEKWMKRRVVIRGPSGISFLQSSFSIFAGRMAVNLDAALQGLTDEQESRMAVTEQEMVVTFVSFRPHCGFPTMRRDD